MSGIDDGVIVNDSGNPTFAEVIDVRLGRRTLLGGGLAATATALLGVDAVLASLPAGAVPRRDLLGFQAIPTSTADDVVVPPGYTARVLIAWGDPVSDGPAFDPKAANSAADQAQQWGMHNDGVVYFPLRGGRYGDNGHGNDRGLLVQNNEYTDDVLLFEDGTAGWNAEKTAKSQNAHGVAIIEIAKVRIGRGQSFEWQVQRPSPYARRITAQTPMVLAGPAAGDRRLQTAADPTGTLVLGTMNNCAMGFTPWGTYLTCEENFNGYFSRKSTAVTPLESRYGVGTGNPVNRWYTTDQRFNIDQHPNEPNRFGYVVEIDPFDPTSTPIKRTALGRLKHEGAWVQETDGGHVVVYMGDDQIFEYIYRFVSAEPWRQAVRAGRSPLEEGVLYVGRFDADGTGEWLPLTPANPALAAWTPADIAINTRGAADAVGATKMDRPEWIDTIPAAKTGLATLTNNTSRTTAQVDAPNPRGPNPYGHILRWSYAHDFDEPTFQWDIFALAGDPANPAHGSTIEGDKYGSPDGLYVAPSGRVWIQTDVSGSTINSGAYAGFGNNQMLCADPTTGETRRFLVGPKVCEVTGCFATPDEKALFVGIQHPGEAPSGTNDAADPDRYSSWPDHLPDNTGRPRSAVLVITKDDGGEIGS